MEGSEADLLLGGSPRSDRTFMSTRDKVGGAARQLRQGGGEASGGHCRGRACRCRTLHLHVHARQGVWVRG